MKKKIRIISLLLIIGAFAILPNSYAALSSKPTTVTDGSNVVVNKNVSTSYALCQQMRSNGESLYGTTVKPHLATNKDWGAVSYLSNSIYGTNTTGGSTGVQIAVNGVNYYSTTGNASGVMNWGVNPNKTLFTQTSGLISNYTSGNNNVTELYNNKDTEYVEFIDPTTNGEGMATIETNGKISQFATGTSTTDLCSIRNGLFGGSFGTYFGSNIGWIRTTGAAGAHFTFRPVVWN